MYLVKGEEWSHERLMSECMRNAAWLRSPKSLGKHYPHPGDLIPFAEILLTDQERIFARGRLLVAAGMGHVGEDNHTYAKHIARNAAGADPNWIIDSSPRVIRHMAWRPCMCCGRRFFSPDVARVRMCGSCKESPIDKS